MRYDVRLKLGAESLNGRGGLLLSGRGPRKAGGSSTPAVGWDPGVGCRQRSVWRAPARHLYYDAGTLVIGDRRGFGEQ